MEQHSAETDLVARLGKLEARLAALEARSSPARDIARTSPADTAAPSDGYWDGFWRRRSLDGN